MKHVPSTVELAAMGLAKPASFTSKGVPSTYAISPEGHALLGDIMRENAAEAVAAGVGRWVQPPTRIIPGITASPWQDMPLPEETG